MSVATKAHAEKSFEDYMRLGPLAALDAIAAATGEKRVNILGFCIGGILVTATLAWLAARKDNRIASATTLATMVDFTDVGEIGVFIDRDRVAALREHMKGTAGLLGGEVRFVLGGSGHIAGVINPPSERAKYGYWTRDDYPDTAEEWLAGATFTEGSWWPLWAGWLEAKDRARPLPARHPGDRDLAVIESAPGSYVLGQ